MSDESDAGTYRCDGHEYENMSEFDLREDFDLFAFPKKLDTFMDWFDDADEVIADEASGHRHFIIGDLEVECNVNEASKRKREVYWTVEVLA